MKLLELFSGTGVLSQTFREHRHQAITVDSDFGFNPDICKDIFMFDITDLPFWPDVVWASIPCQSFSVATIGRNWNTDYTPKSDKARMALELVDKTFEILYNLMPPIWFIENPRGMLRKMTQLSVQKRHTVTYCQYGETRMKPTDIWTNCDTWNPRLPCHPRDKCHESAPRGSKTGTQGLSSSMERAKLPKELCVEILFACEKQMELHKLAQLK